MKKLVLILITLLPTIIFGQQTEGIIIFEETIEHDIEANMSEEDKAHMAQFGDIMAQLGNLSSEKQLIFTAKESIYKAYKPGDDTQTISSEEGDFQIMTMVVTPEEVIYQDYENEKIIEQKEFMQKKFLLNYEMKSSLWKISGEQKEILGYPCIKAMLNDTAESIEAWFTLQIPVPSGPSTFGQLPGMILQVAIDEGKLKLTAKTIEFKTVDKDEIVPPKKGKKVSEEEFRKIAEEKTKEMQEVYEGEGGIRMEIQIGD